MGTLLNEIRENNKKLEECPRHKFDPEWRMPGEPFVCQNCGGKADLKYVIGYIAGYKAMGGDPNAIYVGWLHE